MADEQQCPKCGEECFRDEVDVEVGVIYGPWGCPNCSWSSDPEYDRSTGLSRAEEANPDCYVDQWGGMTRKSVLKERIARFGLNPSVIDEVFGPESDGAYDTGRAEETDRQAEGLSDP